MVLGWLSRVQSRVRSGLRTCRHSPGRVRPGSDPVVDSTLVLWVEGEVHLQKGQA